MSALGEHVTRTLNEPEWVRQHPDQAALFCGFEERRVASNPLHQVIAQVHGVHEEIPLGLLGTSGFL